LKTTHDRYVDVFQALGFHLDLSDYQFPDRRNLSSSSMEIIGDTEIGLIGIAPFAAFEGKTYPLATMEEVIRLLSEEYKVVLFGGGHKETQILESIQNKYDNVVNLAGKLSLKEELDVISNLQLMIAMDSANAHLAAMFGIKTFTVWGVTHPYAGFAPFNQPEEHMILADRRKFPKIPTSVYGNKFPPGYEKAMETITPETIVTRVKINLKN